MAFGGRGAPYHFGSTIRPGYDRDAGVHEPLRRTLVELFPALAERAVTHRWGGPLGIARDWFSSVGLDRADGHRVGRRLRGRRRVDHQPGRPHAARPDPRRATPSSRRCPGSGHRSPRWEPEPLRWLGINAGLWAMKLADRSEARHGRPSRVAGAMGRLLGQ